MQSFQYRPALDGLRALAILPVLLYHADATFATGGFLGVDLFFVLSGYLITSLLVIEARREGAIFLRGFWLRRARRLFPALLVTLLLVSLYAASLASANELARIRADGISTLGYVANWWYIYGGESYFDRFNSPSPLRHTWSLGIEEQWYIFWPIVLAMLFRRHNAGLTGLALGSAIGALFSLFLMAAIFDPEIDPARVYYGTDTHAHGLLGGAALAFVLARPSGRWLSPLLPGAVGLVGAVVFFGLVIGVNDATPWMYRGGFGLAAVASASMILACVRPETSIFKAVLSLKPLVYIGRISYGLYLYHWPIYVLLLPERVGFEGARLMLLRIVLTFAVAIVSFHCIEMPVRRRGVTGFRALGVAVTGVAVTALVLVVATRGAVDESARRTFVHADAVQSEGKLKVLLIGDSVAGSIGNPFQPEWGPGLSVSTRNMRGCGIMTGDLPIPHKPPRIKSCESWSSSYEMAVDLVEPDLVLLSIGSWERYDQLLNGERLKAGSTEWKQYFFGQLRIASEVLGRRGAKVVILTRPCRRRRKLSTRPVLTRPGSYQAVNDVLTQFAERHADIGLIDLADEICEDGRYLPELDGVQLYSDGTHFTVAGSQRVWQFVAPEVERVWQELSAGESLDGIR